jgi:hypothetical protein
LIHSPTDRGNIVIAAIALQIQAICSHNNPVVQATGRQLFLNALRITSAASPSTFSCLSGKSWLAKQNNKPDKHTETKRQDKYQAV